jgi:hypothetical protein
MGTTGMISSRGIAGREAAEDNGDKPTMTAQQQREAVTRRNQGDETLAEIWRGYNVSGWTILRPIA